jgi:hypothetical protein
MIRERLDHLRPIDVLKLNLRLRCLGQLHPLGGQNM